MSLGFDVDDLLAGLLDLVAVAAEVLGTLVAARVLVLERALDHVLARHGDARIVGRQLGLHDAHEVVAHRLALLAHALRVQVLVQLDQLLFGHAQQVEHELVRLGRDHRGRHLTLGLYC